MESSNTWKQYIFLYYHLITSGRKGWGWSDGRQLPHCRSGAGLHSRRSTNTRESRVAATHPSTMSRRPKCNTGTVVKGGSTVVSVGQLPDFEQRKLFSDAGDENEGANNEQRRFSWSKWCLLLPQRCVDETEKEWRQEEEVARQPHFRFDYGRWRGITVVKTDCESRDTVGICNTSAVS